MSITTKIEKIVHYAPWLWWYYLHQHSCLLFKIVLKVFCIGELSSEFGTEGNPNWRLRFTLNFPTGHFDTFVCFTLTWSSRIRSEFMSPHLNTSLPTRTELAWLKSKTLPPNMLLENTVLEDTSKNIHQFGQKYIE